MSAACTYCGGTEWEPRGGVVVCEQCGLTPAQAEARDQRHREGARLHHEEPAPDARDAELRRRSDAVVAATDGMPVRDRLRATTVLLVAEMRLPRELWDQRFGAWKREMQAAARGRAS